jgi:hypothetical protein
MPGDTKFASRVIYQSRFRRQEIVSANANQLDRLVSADDRCWTSAPFDLLPGATRTTPRNTVSDSIFRVVQRPSNRVRDLDLAKVHAT